ncbi:hypothetical protein G5V58_21980 [Nocardioides anomalus]|uniref:Uncharacterized protein n=1 Tax=Nocardioides anomalus TaxID=2712223 RepID=A0A6G6WIC1_9ACTN|nr:hypothetical protein [Nocardioides anomalus]QIG45078.1 hypothetical protein G5V58_21980 [Nocardioides anomalus]
MPTAASWTEVRRSVRDVGHLVAFRAGTVRRPRAFALAASVFAGLTAAAVAVPALMDGAGDYTSGYALDALSLMPSAMAGFLLLSIASAVASGGGRELLHREHATVFPVSPTTDHLGALLLAPLNIAWLLQAWVLLGATAYGIRTALLPYALVGILLWILAATACGQVVAWTIEALRRREHGIAIVRTLGVTVAALAVALQLAGQLGTILDRFPTTRLAAQLFNGFSTGWLEAIAIEAALLLSAVALGAVPAHLAARRLPRDESRVETENFPARRLPRSPLAGLVRTDRGSVWRAVPMRRGLAVLAVGPGVVALAGNLDWAQMTILPGLVASGGALLFGVNAWCLDGRGGLWRESLPVGAWAVFAARAWVLTEFLLAASFVTMVLAGLRAGLPTGSELSALLCTWVVVVLQVVSSAMRWSSRRPFAVDLRSARATPAPPLVMVGYSTKLAVTTTLTSLVFSGLARTPYAGLSVLVAAPFVVWSLVRLLHARDSWTDPVQRARVTTTVAG